MKKDAITSLILSLVALAMLLVSWFWLVPTIKNTQVEVETNRQKKEDYDGQITALNQAKNMLKNAGLPTGIPLKEEVLIKTLPAHREYEDLLAMIERMAREAGLNRPITISLSKPEEGSKGAQETPVSISIAGGYDNIKDFLRRFRETLRPVIIKAVDLSPSEEEDGLVALTMSAITYTRETTNTTTTTSNPTPETESIPVEPVSDAQ